MNFTALDFETANQTRASVCAIGLLRVEGGIVKARIHQLIRPDSPFNYMCTMVHGIREFDVRNAPSFPEFWEEIRGPVFSPLHIPEARYQIAGRRFRPF